MNIMLLEIKNHWFIDDKKRKVLLRGVNLGGSTKVPWPDGATHKKTDFSDHLNVSFVNRPFPPDEAEEHLTRLKSWGFNALRLLTTWEAIEHAGPGKFDTKYLDYFTKIVELCGEYGFYVFIDPHQDVWSRATGGDGAPIWLFEKIGLDYQKFGQSGAARIMQYHYPEYNQMEWAFNYQRFATATMFTLFFGGNTFAPKLFIDDIPVQDYLQDHYISSIEQIAKRVSDMSHVIGFDSLNEPHSGFIGIDDITKLPDLRPPGQVFSPFDAIVAGSGYSRKVAVYKLKLFMLKQSGYDILNPDGVSNWIPGSMDIWKEHGVWEVKNDEPVVLDSKYFAKNPDGSKINFFRDYLRPFIINFTTRIRQIMPDIPVFIEGNPMEKSIYWGSDDPKNIVNASHWYDDITLFTKQFHRNYTMDTENMKIIIGKNKVRNFFKYELARWIQASKMMYDNKISSPINEEFKKYIDNNKIMELYENTKVPTLIGEFGIPFDMHNKKAYKTGNYKKQIQALSLYYDLIDELQLHSTIWNYTADNNHEWGDQWNMEDLSIFSRDDQKSNWKTDINSGGRALFGFVRPHPIAIAGNPIYWKFKKNIFSVKYIPTLIDNEDYNKSLFYIPKIHFPNYDIIIKQGDLKYKIKDQYLTVTHESDKIIEFTVKQLKM